jgi:hypothetical protein
MHAGSIRLLKGTKRLPEPTSPRGDVTQTLGLSVMKVHFSIVPEINSDQKRNGAMADESGRGTLLAMNPTDETLAAHHVLVQSDNAFQRVERLRQARWRYKMGHPIGEHGGKPLGSRLAMPFARESLANYLSDTVRAVVREEVLGPKGRDGKLYSQTRIFNDLLSSQPLCFNLFAELQQDLGLASSVLADVAGISDIRVAEIEFEYSPGRGHPAFTKDNSAFDVFIKYHRGSKLGFFGVEVKYVENMGQLPARFRPRYLEIAHASGMFREDSFQAVRQAPLEQLWRDHLLAASLRMHSASGFDEGTFVVLFPEENLAVKDAVVRYQDCLRDGTSFQLWTLERFLNALRMRSGSAWAAAVEERYLAWDFEIIEAK